MKVVREEVVAGNHGGVASTVAFELAKAPIARCLIHFSILVKTLESCSLLVEMFARWLPYLLIVCLIFFVVGQLA
jgi:hypothetical protein